VLASAEEVGGGVAQGTGARNKPNWPQLQPRTCYTESQRGAPFKKKRKDEHTELESVIYCS